MIYRDIVSARCRNNSLYERWSNVRTTLTNLKQVNNNAQNNTLSNAQAVIGVPTDATSNNNYNSTDITTQSTNFFREFKNLFIQPLNMFS
jgi:hypothetical protein